MTASFENQWQNTPFQEIDGQGIIEDVLVQPSSTTIVFFNPSPDRSGWTKTVQVTYQVCAGQWPPGISSPTPTP
jgi:hypothetical protein